MLDSKSSVPQGTVGSNPTLSASSKSKASRGLRGAFFCVAFLLAAGNVLGAVMQFFSCFCMYWRDASQPFLAIRSHEGIYQSEAQPFWKARYGINIEASLRECERHRGAAAVVER